MPACGKYITEGAFSSDRSPGIVDLATSFESYVKDLPISKVIIPFSFCHSFLEQVLVMQRCQLLSCVATRYSTHEIPICLAQVWPLETDISNFGSLMKLANSSMTSAQTMMTVGYKRGIKWVHLTPMIHLKILSIKIYLSFLKFCHYYF